MFQMTLGKDMVSSFSQITLPFIPPVGTILRHFGAHYVVAAVLIDTCGIPPHLIVRDGL